METKMDFKKRYWVYAVVQYYPVGFLDDVVFVSDDLEECKKYLHDEVSERAWSDNGIFDSLERTYITEE